MADLGDQLRAQLQINEALKERQKLLAANTQLLSKQAQIASALCSSLDCSGLKDMEAAAGGFSSAMGEAADSAEQGLGGMDQGFKKVTEAAGGLLKGLKKLAVGSAILGTLTTALKVLKGGFSLAMGILKGFAVGVKTVVTGLFSLGKAILQVPFTILTGLIQMANQQGISPFRVALEGLRKEMGDFSAGPAKNIKDSVYNIRKSFNDSKSSAVSFGRIFGYGPEGLAEALQFSTDLAKGIGPIFDSMGEEFEANAGKLAKFSKGMGLSGEVMGDIIARSKASGGDYEKTFTEMAHYSQHFAKSFNMSAKNISRDVGTMMSDMEHFGNMSVKEMSELVVQMKRTGIEMKTLQGIVDKFDNFEDASRSAALLRRQFGMMIDARKMNSMNAAERADYIKKQFHATGKSFENLHHMEKKALARTTGIEMKQLQMMLGRGNKEKKMTDVKKEGNKALQAQINQTKILKKLTEQIEKKFSDGSKYASFWEAFTGGLQKGIMRSSAFRKMLRAISRGLRIVERAGIKIGRAFVKHFPGVKGMLGTIADFFSSSRINTAMNKVTAGFIKFFKALENPGGVKKALDELFQTLSDAATEFFGGGDYGGFAKAFDAFASVIGNIKLMIINKALELGAELINGFTKGLEFVMAGGLSGSTEKVAGAIGDGFVDRFGESFSEIKKTFEDKFLPALEAAWPVIQEGLKMAWEKIKIWFDENKETISAALTAGFDFVFSALGDAIGPIWDKHKAKVGAVMALIGLFITSFFIPGGVIAFAIGAAAGALIGTAINKIREWGNKSSEELLKEQAKSEKAAIESFEKEVAPQREKLKKIMNPEEFENFDKRQKDAAALQDSFQKAMKAAKGVLVDSDLQMAVSHMDKDLQEQFLASIKAGLTAEEQKMVSIKDGVLRMDDDLYQKRGKHIEEAVAAFAGKQGYEKKIKELENKATAKVQEAKAKETQLKEKLKKAAQKEDKKKKPMTALEKKAAAEAKKQQEREDKLDALEAAKDTLEKIKALAGVPKELEKVEKDFAKVNVESLKTKIDTLFIKIGQLSTHLSSAIKKAGLNTEKDIIADSVMDGFAAIKEARATIDAIIGKRTVSPKTVELRKQNIINSFDAVVDLFNYLRKFEKDAAAVGNIDNVLARVLDVKGIVDNIAGEGGVFSISTKGLTDRISSVSNAVSKAFEVGGKIGTGMESAPDLTMSSLHMANIMSSVGIVVGQGGIFDQRVEGLTEKIKGTRKAVSELNALAKDLNKVPELVSVLNIGENFTSGEDIKVEIAKTQINVKLSVALDGKKLVKELIKIDVDKEKGQGKHKIATTDSVRPK